MNNEGEVDISGIRPEVLKLAKYVESVLTLNDDIKKSWKEEEISDLVHKLNEEFVEFLEKTSKYSTEGLDASKVIKEGADTAALIMMIIDKVAIKEQDKIFKGRLGEVFK